MESIVRLDKYLVYQPKIDLNTLEIIGLEALVRFLEPNSNKNLSTESVINSISSIEEMVLLTSYVIDRVILDMKKLDKLGWNGNISINMSPREICNTNLYNLLEERFRTDKIYGNRIEIEITEKHEIEDAECMKERISLLKKLGISIAIDDLGAGFNKKELIQEYNVDMVKIDRSFVRNFYNKKEELDYIIDISKKKNIKLLIEGIELEEDLKRFRKLGIEFGQGYLFYKPVDIKEIIEIIIKQK